MVTQAIWTELKFDFTAPAGKYPALVERLAGTPTRLEEKLHDAPLMVLVQPYNNGWSMLEHAGHLIDLEMLLTQRLDDFEQGVEVLSPADMSNQRTNEANYNDSDVKTILKTFRKVRTATIERLNGYDEAMVLRTAMHPRLNTPMRLIDLVLFFAEHDDHHLAKMTQIERELS